MEQYGTVVAAHSSSGSIKLESRISTKVKVAVTRYRTGNNELYVHISKGWGVSLSLHYAEYEELCLIKKAIDDKIHLLDDDVPEQQLDVGEDKRVVLSGVASTPAVLEGGVPAATQSKVPEDDVNTPRSPRQRYHPYNQ